MQTKIRLTTLWATITHESAAEGDVDSRGWVDEHGNMWAEDDKSLPWERELTLQEVCAEIPQFVEPSSSEFHVGVWYIEHDWHEDMRTGATTERTFHLHRDTPEWLQRLVWDHVANEKHAEQIAGAQCAHELESAFTSHKYAGLSTGPRKVHVTPESEFYGPEDSVLFHVGAYEGTYVLASGGTSWSVKGALEDLGAYLADNMPGYITKHDSEELVALYREACEELFPGVPESDLSDEQCCEAQDAATADMTYTESGYLTPHGWGIVGEGMELDELITFVRND